MAKAARLNHTRVGCIRRAFGLQPHRQETFELSTDPLFIDKVRDIVGCTPFRQHHSLFFFTSSL